MLVTQQSFLKLADISHQTEAAAAALQLAVCWTSKCIVLVMKSLCHLYIGAMLKRMIALAQARSHKSAS